MFAAFLYLTTALLGALVAAQEVPPAVSSLGGINPTVYSSVATIVSGSLTSSESDASAQATSTGAANAHGKWSWLLP
jgi:hypothetical protein